MSVWTEHGGRIAAAQARYPHAPQPWLDLSTGINPVPWRGDALRDTDWGPLPAPEELRALETRAGAHFGVTDRSVVALPGTEIGLRLLRAAGLPAPFRYVAPSYSTHARALPDAVSVTASDLEVEASRGGTILLANPNNPDGSMIPRERLQSVADTLASRGGWLTVDEAFADASPDPRAIDGGNLLAFRSFGKFFGLAGVRLGFVVAPEPQAAIFREMVGAWPVSTGALRIGAAAYADREWIERTRVQLVEQAERLDAMLARHFLIARGGCPLFRLVETPDARALFERLAGQGILTRPFDYAPHWLRFGLPADGDALDRLDRALGG